MKDSKERELIDRVVAELKKIGEVQAIYLYGSYARCDEGPMSDIDICVLAPRDVSEGGKTEVILSGSDKVDIHLFWELPVNIQRRVMTEGKLLFEGDWLANHRAQLASLREYLDFRPFFNRQINRTLHIQ